MWVNPFHNELSFLKGPIKYNTTNSKMGIWYSCMNRHLFLKWGTKQLFKEWPIFCTSLCYGSIEPQFVMLWVVVVYSYILWLLSYLVICVPIVMQDRASLFKRCFTSLLGLRPKMWYAIPISYRMLQHSLPWAKRKVINLAQPSYAILELSC